VTQIAKKNCENSELSRWALLPAMILLFAVMLVPLVYLGIQAFEKGSVQESLHRIYSVPLYWQVLKNTMEIAVWVSILSLLLSLPVFLLLIVCSPQIRQFIIAAATMSMLMSILLRSFAWMILLSRWGPLAQIARVLKLIGESEGLLFTRQSVVIGMVHILLPYAILLLWSIKGEETSSNWGLCTRLGSSTFYGLLRVIFPRILPEMVLSFTIIFVFSIGYYITPELLGGGGGSTMMMGVLIAEQVNELGDWEFGSLLGALLVLASFAFLCLGFVLMIIIKGTWHKN